MESRKRKQLGCGVALVVFAAFAGWLYPLVRIAIGLGAAEPELTTKYEGDTMSNLKRISEALQLYKESEGQYPEATGWMDAAMLRLKTSDLTEDEARKKLKDPRLSGAESFGFAMNEAASGKTDKDFPDPNKIILIFSSQATVWNAHGKFPLDQATPARAGGNAGILASGKVVKIADWLKSAK